MIEGVPTTIPFHLKLLDNETFQQGGIYTNFLAEHGVSVLALKR